MTLLPHAGISDGWTNFGARALVPMDVMLWPRKGEDLQPVSDDTPKGVNRRRIFKPGGNRYEKRTIFCCSIFSVLILGVKGGSMVGLGAFNKEIWSDKGI